MPDFGVKMLHRRTTLIFEGSFADTRAAATRAACMVFFEDLNGQSSGQSFLIQGQPFDIFVYAMKRSSFLKVTSKRDIKFCHFEEPGLLKCVCVCFCFFWGVVFVSIRFYSQPCSTDVHK